VSDESRTVEYETYFAPIKAELEAVFTPAECKKVEQAFELASASHAGQKRSSGEPYISHPVAVARILLEDLGMDCETICAALLHDVMEDCGVSRKTITEKFGKVVADLVDGVSKLGNIKYTSKDELQSENIRKMLLAMSHDIRVMLIKLADRLHNMRTLKYRPEEKQRDTALETMEIYAPIAHRLGMHALKNELEDHAIRCLDPIGCGEIEAKIAMDTREQSDFLDSIKQQISESFKDCGFDYRVDGRVKSMCGIYRKIFIENRDIYDTFAVRIIVNAINECYMALGIIHDTFKPIPDRFKDFISLPKNNGYRSIHTTVISNRGIPFEVQIRTFEMHQEAEYGIAAHWKYKVGIEDKDAKNARFEQRVKWLREMLEAKDEADGEEDLRNSIKAELTDDDVFVFTPKGEVRVLPWGATIIDFAYAIHSAVGNRMVGAKVNGKITPIDSQLTSGTVIEILTTSAQGHGPSRDWLKAAKTSEARNKIRQWFKRERRDENITAGRDDFEREVRRINPRLTSEQYQSILADTARRNHFLHEEDFFASIGYGGILISKLLPKLREDCARYNAPDVDTIKPAAPPAKVTHSNGGVIVEGFDNCLVKFAKCCNPVPGDDIIGFVTRGGGVAVHRRNCNNVIKNIDKEPGRWLHSSWATKEGEVYKAVLSLMTMPNANLFNTISQLLASENLFTEGILLTGKSDKGDEYEVVVRVGSNQQLRGLVSKLSTIPGVLWAKRI